MVKNPVKVYARLKNIHLVNEATVYSIRKKENYDVLALYKYAKQRNKYKFHKIFDQNSSQEDVFENTTKSIVNSVLHGFNGTIFAYGQTGSGKTYSMTGCSDEYDNRGIIPRCIQEIFQFTNKSPDQYTIFISYMEIYNEIGYDLLNPKHQATKLEELPRVTLLDDGKGEAHLRNLFMLPVMTEQEAMRLLFLGDTNRTIAETPMNDYSSRSHCIFTIYITRTENERKIRKSKLNLVDLAGSERIYKTNISGATLTEAKNINLSLHYLEQVILALSQSKRSHIPFRNSMMTYMLRDSLAGNSITVMLATLSIKASNLEETVTTCNFSQRVAMVNTDAMINEIFDPQEEIDYLRNQVTNLRKKLSSPSNIPSTGQKELSESETEFCEAFAEKYLKTGVWNNTVTINLEQCVKCFQTFRNIIIKLEENLQIKQESESNPIDEYGYAKSDIVDKFKEIIKQKDEEIDILTQLLEAYDLSKNHNVTNSERPVDKHLEKSENEEIELTVKEEDLFEEFLNKDNNNAQLTNFKSQIESKCQSAEQISTFVESCQQNILRLRRKLEIGYGITDLSYVTQIQNSLKSQQDVYAKSIENLKKIKEETDFLEHGLKQERIHLERKFCNQRRELVNKSKASDNKSTLDNGLFTRINESLRNIERKFSAKVKNQPKSVSPKKSVSELLVTNQENRLKVKDRTEKRPICIPKKDKMSNTNTYIDKLKITNPNKETNPVINSYTSDRHICTMDEQFVDPIKEISTKKSMKPSISTARMVLLSSNKLSDKWDTLKKQQNELYNSYGDPPGNISRLVIPNANPKLCSKEGRYISDQIKNENVDHEQIHPTSNPPDEACAIEINTVSNHTSNNSPYLRIGNCLNRNLESKNLESDKINPANMANSKKNDKINPILNSKKLESERVCNNLDDLSDNDSDLIFERKMQSYLKTIPTNPRKENHPQNYTNGMGDSDNNTSYIKNSEYKRCMNNNNNQLNQNDYYMYKNSAQLSNMENLSVNHVPQLNRTINRMKDNHYNSPPTNGSVEILSNAKNLNQIKKMAEINTGVHKNSSGQGDIKYATDDKVMPQQNIQNKRHIVDTRDHYNRQALPSSNQIEITNYDEDVSYSLYNEILQEEHIPVKDFTISHRSNSSDEQLQPDQHPKQHEIKSIDNLSVFLKGDTEEFIAFMQTIPLTGDEDVDEEIVKFYRTKFTKQ